MSLLTEPCDTWDYDLSCCDLPEDTDPDLIESAAQIATMLLWARSGRRYGTCPVTVRPCRLSCLDGFSTGGRDGRLMPYTVGGRWYNAAVCGCGSRCSCTELCEVWLPGPVGSITSVQIDGVTVDPATYRLDAPGLLVRQGGECWPSCQDLSAPLGDEGTFGVTYPRGIPVDPAGEAAMGELTCELVKNCIPDCTTCRISQKVVRRTMQGQTIELASGVGSAWLDNLPLVSAWLDSVNPNRLPAAPRVLSPDAMPPRRTVWEHSID